MHAGEDAAISDQHVSQSGGVVRLPAGVPAEMPPIAISKASAKYSGQVFFKDYPALPSEPNDYGRAVVPRPFWTFLSSKTVLDRGNESNPMPPQGSIHYGFTRGHR